MHLLREWTTAYVNSLPDSSFAYVKGNVRKLPYKDADGKVDLPHVRNALARLNQAQGISAEEKAKIKAKLEKVLENNKNLEDEGLGYITLLSANNERVSSIEILREGTIQDRGLVITRQMLEQYVENFNSNVVGDVDEHGNPELPVNLEHKIGSAAAGWIKKLYINDADGTARLMAEVHWTELGQDNIGKRLYKYTSSELNAKYPHHKTGKLFKNVLSGLALTNSPALKAQRPLVLSSDVDQLFNNINMFEKLLTKLSARAFVAKEDKVMLRELLSELPADEQEANKEKVEEVEAKPEAPEKTEEEKKAEAEAAEKAEAEKKAAEEAKVAAEQQQLAMKTQAEELAAKAKEVETLKQQLAKVEAEKLTTTLTAEAQKLMVSEDKLTGFVGDGVKEEIVKLTSQLTPEQREAFYALMGKVRTVTLKEIGSTKTAPAKEESEKELMGEAKKRAQELNKQDPKMYPMHVALEKAYKELGLVKPMAKEQEPDGDEGK